MKTSMLFLFICIVDVSFPHTVQKFKPDSGLEQFVPGKNVARKGMYTLFDTFTLSPKFPYTNNTNKKFQHCTTITILIKLIENERIMKI